LIGLERDIYDYLSVADNKMVIICNKPDFGVSGDVQHESYIASWLKSLKDDKRYIFKATSAASKAHKYLTEF
jgi:antirestriction protein ArdC